MVFFENGPAQDPWPPKPNPSRPGPGPLAPQAKPARPRTLGPPSQTQAGPAQAITRAYSFRLESPLEGRTGSGLAWGPRVLGRAGLVFNTLKNHDRDKDVNMILLRNMTVIRMLI